MWTMQAVAAAVSSVGVKTEVWHSFDAGDKLVAMQPVAEVFITLQPRVE